MSASMFTWLAEPPARALSEALARLSRTEDVVHIAVMPDAHLAEEVCVGTVTATTRRLLPAAVGGDIGCGMAAVRFQAGANLHLGPKEAAQVLLALERAVPCALHPAAQAPPLPEELDAWALHAPSAESKKRREGRLELGTLGRGNHFLELQRDEQGDLWLMVHSGSRAMGPTIRDWYSARATRDPTGIAWLDAESSEGQAYLSDLAWALRYAHKSRERMVAAVATILGDLFGIEADLTSHIACEHNHVRREVHNGKELWVHRKGAMHLDEGQLGVVPGSMGSPSFHVEGRAHPLALRSSAHGAGRALSRTDARKRISLRALERETKGVFFDHRLAHRLLEEAPSAYKDISMVMRAQRELVRVRRKLTPLLVYKGA